MPRQHRIRPHRPFAWTQRGIDAFEKRLQRRKPELVRHLSLDVTKDVDELEAAISDLNLAILKAWAILREIDQAATSAIVRMNLRRMQNHPEKLEELLPVLDPETKGHIEDNYPGEAIALEFGRFDQSLVLLAIDQALRELGDEEPGRPTGSHRKAAISLVNSLVQIFEDYSGIEPTRRVDPWHNYAESGPFRDFVEFVFFSIIPSQITRRKNGLRISIDHLIKQALRTRLAARGSDKRSP